MRFLILKNFIFILGLIFIFHKKFKNYKPYQVFNLKKIIIMCY